MVPDTAYGQTLFPACQKHDWMYYVAEDEEDKIIADVIFRVNMTLLIIHENDFLDRPRLRRELTYFAAVYYHGGGAFNKDEVEKLPVEEMIKEFDRQALPS